MRSTALITAAALSLLLAACGSDEKTVVVNPQPNTTIVNPPAQQPAQGNTVVVPQAGSTTKICADGAVTC